MGKNNGELVILDVCCGGRMFWFDKQDQRAIFVDKRQGEFDYPTNRILTISPDIVADFKNLPFDDKSFYHVVFDPPHLIKAGSNSWLAKKYGVLPTEWENEIRKGFEECFRVLKPFGTLVFKWNEDQVKLKDILKLTDEKPLYGNQRGKTHWITFLKAGD